MSWQPQHLDGTQRTPCEDLQGDCAEHPVVSAPAHHPLRQALGSNHGDIRLPSLLLSLAALLAVLAKLVRRRARVEEDAEDL
jgi:hypothetical protein